MFREFKEDTYINLACKVIKLFSSSDILHEFESSWYKYSN